MLDNFLYYIFEPFGFSLLPFDLVFQDIRSFEHWFQLLSPDVFIPLMFYITIAYGFLYILFILPFRYFKRLIKAPDKKGKR